MGRSSRSAADYRRVVPLRRVSTHSRDLPTRATLGDARSGRLSPARSRTEGTTSPRDTGRGDGLDPPATKWPKSRVTAPVRSTDGTRPAGSVRALVSPTVHAPPSPGAEG